MAKSLVVFFSISGVTKKVAEDAARIEGCPVYEIKTAEPYPADYHAVVDAARKELAENARPKLAGELPDISDVDKIILGFPNWCSTCPMPVLTFLESLDLNGKKLLPFITHGGGGTGHADVELKNACKGADLRPCANGNPFNADSKKLEDWLKS